MKLQMLTILTAILSFLVASPATGDEEKSERVFSNGGSDPIEAMIYHTKKMVELMKANRDDCNEIVTVLEAYSAEHGDEFDEIMKTLELLDKSMKLGVRKQYEKKTVKKLEKLMSETTSDFIEIFEKCPAQARRIGDALRFVATEEKQAPGMTAEQEQALAELLANVDTSDAPGYLREIVGHIKNLNRLTSENLPHCKKVLSAVEAYVAENGARMRSAAKRAERVEKGMTKVEKRKLSAQAMSLMKPVMQETMRVQKVFARKCPEEMARMSEIMSSVSKMP